MGQLRLTVTLVAALAMMLRAFVPVGWMPSGGAANAATLMPCPMMDRMGGMAMPQNPADHSAKHQLPPSHEGSICAFATSAQPVRALLPVRIGTASEPFELAATIRSFLLPAWDHVPRAPPLTA